MKTLEIVLTNKNNCGTKLEQLNFNGKKFP